MSGLTGSPINLQNATGETLSLGPFWPELSFDEMREIARVGNGVITGPRMVFALKNAALRVGRDLASKYAAWQIEGYSKLENVPSAEFDGETELVFLWKSAVYNYAAASLVKTHQDVSASNDGVNRSEDILPNAKKYETEALAAIRQIKGINRTTVDLI